MRLQYFRCPWRTEYPIEFPVITSIKESVSTNDIRPIDFNGHTPEPCDECPECLREDPAYRLGYRDAMIDVLAAVATAANDELAAAVAKVQARLESEAA